MAARNAMNLNDTQRQTVAGWVAEGLKLSEVQNRLAADLGVRMTYMEVRLLVDDLKLKLKDPEVPKPAVPVARWWNPPWIVVVAPSRRYWCNRVP